MVARSVPPRSLWALLVGLALATAACGQAAAQAKPSKSQARTPLAHSSSSATPTSTGPPLPSGNVTILEVGDSLGVDLGWGLQWALAKDPHVKVVADAKGDTGLVNTAYYNWPAVFRQELSATHPQVVVVFLGANDVQSFYLNGSYVGFGSATWKSVYSERVSTMMDEALAAKARVIWVGEPIMQSQVFSSSMKLVDAIFKKEAASHPGVVYFSSWPLFTTSTGAFNGGTTTINGIAEPLRAGDGIHLSIGGEDLLASALVRTMKADYRLP